MRVTPSVPYMLCNLFAVAACDLLEQAVYVYERKMRLGAKIGSESLAL